MDYKQLHIKLETDLHRRIKIAAAVHERTIQDYVVDVLQAALPSAHAPATQTAPRSKRRSVRV